MNYSYPQPGTILAARYRVGEIIGRGGMGVVLAAENIVTQRRVAIKWLRSDLVDNAEAAERLVREASVASRIRHPNVVDVFDVLRDGTSIFLVMDLLQGESLEVLLHRGGIPLHELISILLPAMRGVAEAHRQDIVHRDIHPGNIFLSRESHDPRPVPMVLDFGISKFGKMSAEQLQLTRSNMCMGTPLYMSYEQFYSARDVDVRTDVYSFGVILYEGLTGKPPFDGESLMEVAGKVTAGTPVHPKILRPEIPTALAELVLWAIARKREDRIQTIAEFIQELEPFATERAFRGQMTDVEKPLPRIARSERIADAIPVDDEVESVEDSFRPSHPPPIRHARRANDRSQPPSPPLTTLASRPLLTKEIDTLGQHSSELAQSLRPASPRQGARQAVQVAVFALIVIGAFAAWKLADRGPLATTNAAAASKEEPAPVVPAVAPPAPAPAAPGPDAPQKSQPQSLQPIGSLPSPVVPPEPVAPVKPATDLPAGRIVPRDTLGAKALIKKPQPAPVHHRAGELNDPLL